MGISARHLIAVVRTVAPDAGEQTRHFIRNRKPVEPSESSAAHRLRGLAIDNMVDADGAPLALLRGESPEQAALLGMFHTHNDYQLPLLSAEFLSPAGDAGPSDNGWRPVRLPDEESP